MESAYNLVAGLDIHKKTVVVVVLQNAQCLFEKSVSVACLPIASSFWQQRTFWPSSPCTRPSASL